MDSWVREMNDNVPVGVSRRDAGVYYSRSAATAIGENSEPAAAIIAVRPGPTRT